jgi:hypothetical protein
MADAYQTRRAESMWADMVATKTSEKAYEEDGVRSGLALPQVQGEGAGITYDVQIGGGKQKGVHKAYALGVRITEEAIEDNLYELGRGGGEDLKEMSKDLGIAMEENLEVYMARFLVSGTAATYHVVREATTYPLFYATHLRLDGSTYSNVSTETDLTYEVLSFNVNRKWKWEEGVLPTTGEALRGALDLKVLLLHPGRLYLTSTHVDLILRLNNVSIPIRVAGLDLDPGWVPDFGRIVLFHYE